MSPAPTIDELLVGDDPVRWAELGFAVADGCCEIGGIRLRFLDGDSDPTAGERGIRGWTLRDLAAGDIAAGVRVAGELDESVALDGLPTTRSEDPPRPPAPAHPNGVVAIDHVVASSPSLDRSVRVLRRAGLDLRRMRDEPTPGGAPRQAFFRLGAEILELIQLPEDLIQRAGGVEGPARFWGLALRAEDLDATARLLGAHVGEIRPAVQRGRRIASLRRAAGLAVPLAFMSAAPAM